jgi:hypothetical protein
MHTLSSTNGTPNKGFHKGLHPFIHQNHPFTKVEASITNIIIEFAFV